MSTPPDLKSLLMLSMDNAGSKSTLPVADAMRLITSAYKLGYRDGVNDSVEMTNAPNQRTLNSPDNNSGGSPALQT